MARYNQKPSLVRENLTGVGPEFEPVLEYLNVLSRNVAQVLQGGIGIDNENQDTRVVPMKHNESKRITFNNIKGRVVEVRIAEWDNTDPRPTETQNRVDDNTFDISVAFASAPSQFVNVTFKAKGA